MRLKPVKILKLHIVGASLAVVLFFGLLPAGASAEGGAISQAYQTNASSITGGALVSLVNTGSNQVVPATSSNVSNLVGIAAEKPVLELSGSGSSSVQVVVGGSAQVLVSDANGAVSAGDKITISPLAGIGMKATGASEIVGTAQKSLSSVKTIVERAKGTSGQPVTVHVGLVPVAVNVVYYSAAAAGGSVSAFVPPFLQDLANAIAGKQVSPLRVLIGVLAMLLGFVSAITMLYVGIRSGVISLGRNPLAAEALRKGMVDILIAAIGVIVVTGVIVAAVVVA